MSKLYPLQPQEYKFDIIPMSDPQVQISVLADNPGEAEIMMRAADSVGFKAQLIDDPEMAATAYRNYAYDVARLGTQVLPEEFAETARRNARNGGALIRLTLNKGQDTSEFFNLVKSTKETQER